VSEFLKELKLLLAKHCVEIEAEDHWHGYPEFGKDVCMKATIQSAYKYGECIRKFEQHDLGRIIDGDMEVQS
jgi:IS1 family transposase